MPVPENADRDAWRQAYRHRCTTGEDTTLDLALVAKIEAGIEAEEEELYKSRYNTARTLPPPPLGTCTWNTHNVPARPPLPWQAGAAIVLCVHDIFF